MRSGDVTKLPKWAQQEIERLERDVEHFQATLSVGPDDSNTFADPYSSAPRPLGHGTTIEFVMTDGTRIRVRAERNSVSGAYDRIDVNGGDTIAVLPRAANSVEIQVQRR